MMWKSRLMCVLALSSLLCACSFGGETADPTCGDFGNWDGAACVCVEGYHLDPANAENCLAEAVDCSGHGELVNGACDCEEGYITDPADPTDCIDEEELVCGGHGHIHDGQYCSCDDGYMQDPEDIFNCISDPDFVCTGHGELVDGACVCEEGYEQVPDDVTACQREGSQHTDGTAVDVTLLLHSDQVKLVLHSLQVQGVDVTDFDLYMAHDGPGPNLKLGPGVTGVNMGSGTDYLDVAEAPADGYVADEGTNYLIGTGFIAGGEGSSGYDMTENVYVLKLADGTYAKVEVLSAAGGVVHVLCYRQPDGSRDLATDTIVQQ